MSRSAREPCPHRPPCPGCPRYGEPGLAPAAHARLAALARDADLAPPEVFEGARFGFRHRARLMVRGRASSPKLGIFAAGTHDLVDIPRCRIHHPLVNRVATELREAIRSTATRPYDERRHAGLLRAVQIVVERASQTAQVVLVANTASPEPIGPLATAFGDRAGPLLHSLWWNGNPERTNVVLGRHWRRLAGSEAVREAIGGAAVHFPPGAFGQSHLDLADDLVARVHAAVPDGARVVDLYAGCGAFGLGLLRRCAHVGFVESAPDAVRGLALGLAARPDDERARATVREAPAGEALGALCGADVVIADPPRKGLDAALTEALATTAARKLLYVSCDLDSLLRDLARLTATNRLRLAHLEAWSLFPNTDHVETLAILEQEARPSSGHAARAPGP